MRSSDQEGPIIPDALERTLRTLIGDEVALLERSMHHEPPTSIRLNPFKDHNTTGERVPWCGTGRYLEERPVFTLDPLYQAGTYYVQEASSMFLEQALRSSGMLDRDILALDLCAAPGGKSTHLRALLSKGSLLVANEVDGKRRSILEENVWKWGLPGVVVAGSIATDLRRSPEFYDLILVDAPCSGEGMLRKDPQARSQWSGTLVTRCATTQRSLLDEAWAALRPGGILIYSTCTWEPVENEEQFAAQMSKGAEAMDITLDPAWGIERREANDVIGFRCYPHRLRGEGFFLAMLRKPGSWEEHPINVKSQHDHEAPRQWIRNGEEQLVTEADERLFAVDTRWKQALHQLMNAMRITAPGMPIAERKAGQWRPHAALALNTALLADRFPTVDLNDEEVLHFLRGNALPATDARGTALAVTKGLPLGWLHGAGTRWNNRWPMRWRVRMH